MIVPSRRLFLTGGAAFVAAPALVRAESLDAVLRGFSLDPWSVAFSFPDYDSDIFRLSQFDPSNNDFNTGWPPNSLYHLRSMDAKQRVVELNKARPYGYNIKYHLMRKSEVHVLYRRGKLL